MQQWPKRSLSKNDAANNIPGCKFLQEFRFRSFSAGQFKYRACIQIHKLRTQDKTIQEHNLFLKLKSLTSKPEQPHKLSFFSRLCLIISFWWIRCSLAFEMCFNSESLLSSGTGFWELGSQMVMPQSMSSRRGNWAAANWMPPENYRQQINEPKTEWKQITRTYIDLTMN